MSQGSVVLPTTGTVSGLTMTQDTNTALATLITLNSGASAPTTGGTGLAGLAGVLWHDTTNNLLKIRDQADTTWITIGGIDETNKIYLNPLGGGAASIASASTTDLGSTAANFLTITGTTTITSFGSSMKPGQSKIITFAAALTLTYNGTSMILPSGQNITTAANDQALVSCISSGNYLVEYNAYSGIPTCIGAGQLAGFRNKLINGDFRRWDYGTSYALTTSGAYGSANRWGFSMSTTAAGIANQDTSITAGTGFKYNLKLGRNNGSTSTGQIVMYQALESVNSIPLAGKTVTLSFYAKAGANFSGASSQLNVFVGTGTGTDQAANGIGSWTGTATPISNAAVLTTSWQRFTYTGTIASSATQVGVEMYYSGVGTAGADDNVYITGIQLEPGPVATPFEDRGEAIEALLCARYLPVWTSTGGSSSLGSGGASTTTVVAVALPFHTPARVAPTGISLNNGAYITVNDGTTATASTSVTYQQSSKDTAIFNINVAAGLTQFRPYIVYFNTSAALLYFTGSEL